MTATGPSAVAARRDTAGEHRDALPPPEPVTAREPSPATARKVDIGAVLRELQGKEVATAAVLDHVGVSDQGSREALAAAAAKIATFNQTADQTIADLRSQDAAREKAVKKTADAVDLDPKASKAAWMEKLGEVRAHGSGAAGGVMGIEMAIVEIVSHL